MKCLQVIPSRNLALNSFPDLRVTKEHSARKGRIFGLWQISCIGKTKQLQTTSLHYNILPKIK